MADVPAVGRIIHHLDTRAPGRCFAAIITSAFPGGFESEVFWPPAFRMGAPRDFIGREQDAGVEWHWPRDPVWHGED